MFALDNINKLRKKVIEIISNTSPEALNKVPPGFNNNIAWNFGHIVVTGYALVFKVTGVNPDFKIPYLEKFGKGTRPEGIVIRAEINGLIELSDRFITTVKVAMNETDQFNGIKEYTTATFGVPITTIDEMLVTVAMHDAVHLQVIRDYKRILGE